MIFWAHLQPSIWDNVTTVPVSRCHIGCLGLYRDYENNKPFSIFVDILMICPAYLNPLQTLLSLWIWSIDPMISYFQNICWLYQAKSMSVDSSTWRVGVPLTCYSLSVTRVIVLSQVRLLIGLLTLFRASDWSVRPSHGHLGWLSLW